MTFVPRAHPAAATAPDEGHTTHIPAACRSVLAAPYQGHAGAVRPVRRAVGYVPRRAWQARLRQGRVCAPRLPAVARQGGCLAVEYSGVRVGCRTSSAHTRGRGRGGGAGRHGWNRACPLSLGWYGVREGESGCMMWSTLQFAGRVFSMLKRAGGRGGGGGTG